MDEEEWEFDHWYTATSNITQREECHTIIGHKLLPYHLAMLTINSQSTSMF